ncbi:hypothetical protein CR513_46422, partial [Mucuna pruriens]
MKNFEMKDLGETSFVLGIQILRDRSQGILRLSQENYISKVLDKFDMKDSKLGDTPIVKGDKFSLKQCPTMTVKEMRCKRFPIPQYLSDPRMQHWKAVKCVIRYLKRIK